MREPYPAAREQGYPKRCKASIVLRGEPLRIESEDWKACDIILRGGTPRSVAVQLPIWFIKNHVGLICLWETINRKPWRPNE